jgi:hypothetical protein
VSGAGVIALLSTIAEPAPLPGVIFLGVAGRAL